MSDDLFLVNRTSIAQAGTTASSAPTGPQGDPANQPPAAASAGAPAEEQAVPSGRPKPNSAVVFSWSESIPGAGACQAAMFTGRFFCQVATIVGKPDELNGAINLVLHGSTEAQSLSIDGGQIRVYDANMTSIVIATVGGALECGTQRLRATIDPTPTVAMPVDRQISWVNFTVQPITTGTLTGSLDPDLQEITGELEIDFEPTTRCVGQFRVKAWAFE